MYVAYNMQSSAKNQPYTEQVPCSITITIAVGVIVLLGYPYSRVHTYSSRDHIAFFRFLFVVFRHHKENGKKRSELKAVAK